jgi:hypothetical protein
MRASCRRAGISIDAEGLRSRPVYFDIERRPSSRAEAIRMRARAGPRRFTRTLCAPGGFGIASSRGAGLIHRPSRKGWPAMTLDILLGLAVGAGLLLYLLAV